MGNALELYKFWFFKEQVTKPESKLAFTVPQKDSYLWKCQDNKSPEFGDKHPKYYLDNGPDFIGICLHQHG